MRNSDVEYDILTDGAWLRAHDIISKAELTVDEVNFLCSNTPDNEKNAESGDDSGDKNIHKLIIA